MYIACVERSPLKFIIENVFQIKEGKWNLKDTSLTCHIPHLYQYSNTYLQSFMSKRFTSTQDDQRFTVVKI